MSVETIEWVKRHMTAARERRIRDALTSYDMLTPPMQAQFSRIGEKPYVEDADGEIVEIWQALSAHNLVVLFINDHRRSWAIARLSGRGRALYDNWQQAQRLPRQPTSSNVLPLVRR